MSSVLNRKARRANTKTPGIDINKVKEQATQKAVNQIQETIISAMLIALNTQLKIGPKRGAKVVNEINRLINEIGTGATTHESLKKEAQKRMKIKIK